MESLAYLYSFSPELAQEFEWKEHYPTRNRRPRPREVADMKARYPDFRRFLS